MAVADRREPRVLLRHLLAYLILAAGTVPLGYLPLRLLLGPLDRSRRAERLVLCVPFGLLFILVINLILAAGGATFLRFLTLAAFPWGFGLALLLRDLGTRRTAPPQPSGAPIRPLWVWSGSIAVLILFIIHTALPNRFLGGADTGAYTSITYGFYARGGLTVPSPLAAAAPAAGLDPRVFVPVSHRVDPTDPGAAFPGFPAGAPLLAAPGYELTRGLLGDLDAIFVTWQFCGLVALLLFWALADRLGGALAVHLAVVLLSFNWLQFWLTRSTWSELPLQLFTLAIILLAVAAIRDRDPRRFAAAALLAAALLPVKFESALLLLPLGAALLLVDTPRPVRIRLALLLLLAPALVAVLYFAVHPGMLGSYLVHNLGGFSPVPALFRGWIDG